MKVPSRVLQLICHVCGAAPRFASPPRQLGVFQTVDALPATLIRALRARIVLPHGMHDVAELKIACSQASFRRRKLLQPPTDFHSAKCEMVGDPPSRLLFLATARASEAPLRRVHLATPSRECARIHPLFVRAL